MGLPWATAVLTPEVMPRIWVFGQDKYKSLMDDGFKSLRNARHVWKYSWLNSDFDVLVSPSFTQVDLWFSVNPLDMGPVFTPVGRHMEKMERSGGRVSGVRRFDQWEEILAGMVAQSIPLFWRKGMKHRIYFMICMIYHDLPSYLQRS